jgi:hypothetical protein
MGITMAFSPASAIRNGILRDGRGRMRLGRRVFPSPLPPDAKTARTPTRQGLSARLGPFAFAAKTAPPDMKWSLH